MDTRTTIPDDDAGEWAICELVRRGRGSWGSTRAWWTCCACRPCPARCSARRSASDPRPLARLPRHGACDPCGHGPSPPHSLALLRQRRAWSADDARGVARARAAPRARAPIRPRDRCGAGRPAHDVADVARMDHRRARRGHPARVGRRTAPLDAPRGRRRGTPARRGEGARRGSTCARGRDSRGFVRVTIFVSAGDCFCHSRETLGLQRFRRNLHGTGRERPERVTKIVSRPSPRRVSTRTKAAEYWHCERVARLARTLQ